MVSVARSVPEDEKMTAPELFEVLGKFAGLGGLCIGPYTASFPRDPQKESGWEDSGQHREDNDVPYICYRRQPLRYVA
jgi:hypothetical protein